MWSAPSRAHNHGMSRVSSPRITLELDVGADPIRGTIEHGDGSRLPFWGWLELMEALRRVAAGDPEPASTAGPANAGQAPEPDKPRPRPNAPS